MLLSKEKTQENSLRALWTAYSVDRRVKGAIETLFSEPSPWLVRRLAKEVDGLAASDVRAALGRARLQLDFPDEELPRTSRRVVEKEARVSSTSRRASGARRPTPKEVSRVTVKDLIEAGLIDPPLDLTRAYKGRQLSARIERDGRVSCLGNTYESVSVAGGYARRSVIGANEGRKYPQTNGWTFWRFRDEDGETRELTVLRERFVAQRTPV